MWLGRDLKPENFLFDKPGAEGVLKVTDFGLSCGIQTPDSIITEVGMRQWRWRRLRCFRSSLSRLGAGIECVVVAA